MNEIISTYSYSNILYDLNIFNKNYIHPIFNYDIIEYRNNNL